MCECVVYFDRILFISRPAICFVVRGLVKSCVRARVHYFEFCAARGCASAGLFSIVFCLLRVLRYVFCPDPVRSYAQSE